MTVISSAEYLKVEIFNVPDLALMMKRVRDRQKISLINENRFILTCPKLGNIYNREQRTFFLLNDHLLCICKFRSYIIYPLRFVDFIGSLLVRLKRA